MKHATTFISAALIAVTLAACSTVDKPEPTPNSSETTTTATEKTIKIGEPTQTATKEGNDVVLTLTDAQLGGECFYGTTDYDWIPQPVKEGYQQLQLRGNLQVNSLNNPETKNDYIHIQAPEVIDKDGFTVDAKRDTNCLPANDEHTIWHDPVNTGEKKKIYGAWVVPLDVKEIRVQGLTVENPVQKPQPSQSDSSGKQDSSQPDANSQPQITPAPTSAVPTQAPNTTPPVVGYTGAPGHDSPKVLDKVIDHCGEKGMYQTGTTFFTDGTTGWTQTCSTQMQ